MRKRLSQWMAALRKNLHLTAIEQNIAAHAKALEDQELRASAVQVFLVNQQKQHLEITLNELNRAVHEIRALIADERIRKEKVDMNVAKTIDELTTQVGKLNDTVTEHIKLTIPK